MPHNHKKADQHKSSEKERLKVNHKIKWPLCIHLENGHERDGDGIVLLFSFSNGQEIDGQLFEKTISAECVVVSFKMN